MKKLIAISILALSFNAFSTSIVGTVTSATESIIASLLATSSGSVHKEAAQLINDAQEFIQSGNMTPFLSQKIKLVESLDSGMSDLEALDALISASEKLLQ